MSTTALTCEHCGAPLPEIPDGVEQIRCTHCSTLLRIERSEEGVFAREIAELSRRQDELENKFRKLKLGSIRGVVRRRRRAANRDSASKDDVDPQAAFGAIGLVCAAIAAFYGPRWAWIAALAAVAIIWGGLTWRSYARSEARSERIARRRSKRRGRD